MVAGSSPLRSETVHCSEGALAVASLVSNLVPHRREVGLRLRHWEIGLADLVVSRFRRGADAGPDSLEMRHLSSSVRTVAGASLVLYRPRSECASSTESATATV